MKSLFKLILILPSLAFGEVRSFFPENDLYIPEDEGFAAAVDEMRFHRIIDIGEALSRKFAEMNKERVYFERKWSSGRVNADVMRNNQGVVRIRMYGGLARHPDITPEGLALVMAHEIAHAYCWMWNKNPVYIAPEFKMCSEGNADYDGAYILQHALPYMADMELDLSYGKKMFEACDTDVAVSSTSNCIARLNAGLSVTRLLAKLAREKASSYDKRDTRVVRRTQRSYPDTVQCRLDNMWDGVFRKPYSKCWYSN